MFREFLLNCTTFTLDSDLNGTYKFYMLLEGLKRFISTFPQFATTYTNWCTLNVIENKDEYILPDKVIPAKYEDYFLNSHEGAITGILNVYEKKLVGYNKVASQLVLKDGSEFSKLNVEIWYK